MQRPVNSIPTRRSHPGAPNPIFRSQACIYVSTATRQENTDTEAPRNAKCESSKVQILFLAPVTAIVDRGKTQGMLVY